VGGFVVKFAIARLVLNTCTPERGKPASDFIAGICDAGFKRRVHFWGGYQMPLDGFLTAAIAITWTSIGQSIDGEAYSKLEGWKLVSALLSFGFHTNIARRQKSISQSIHTSKKQAPLNGPGMLLPANHSELGVYCCWDSIGTCLRCRVIVNAASFPLSVIHA